MKPIDSFTGEHRWLSNFWITNVVFEDVMYPSSEHAYQASKTLEPELRLMIRDLPTPGKAKRMGKKIPIRPDWDQVKLSVMEKILESKFRLNPELRQKLIETGNVELIEGNTWDDFFWGVCDGKGENHLGKILMKIRVKLQE